jgi:hypothetical protein
MSQWMRDMLERTVATYVEAFVGLVLAAEMVDGISLGVLEMAAVSALPAALAVVKAALVSRRRGL